MSKVKKRRKKKKRYWNMKKIKMRETSQYASSFVEKRNPEEHLNLHERSTLKTGSIERSESHLRVGWLSVYRL